MSYKKSNSELLQYYWGWAFLLRGRSLDLPIHTKIYLKKYKHLPVYSGVRWVGPLEGVLSPDALGFFFFFFFALTSPLTCWRDPDSLPSGVSRLGDGGCAGCDLAEGVLLASSPSWWSPDFGGGCGMPTKEAPCGNKCKKHREFAPNSKSQW